MDKDDKIIDVNESEELDLAQEVPQNNINDVESASNNDDWKVVEKAEHKGSNVLKAVGMVVAIIVILGGMAWSGMKLYDLTQAPSYNKPEGEVNQVVGIGEEKPEEESSEVEDTTINVDEQRMVEINEYVHHMANTIILAVDGKINGTKQITMETIDEALGMVKDVDLYLYKEISKWKEGDFSNGVDVHNYVWKNLDGEIGKASKLDEEAIQAVKTNLGL